MGQFAQNLKNGSDIYEHVLIFLTSLLFQSSLYVVLAHGKGPKNTIHRDLFRTKNPKQNPPDSQLHFMHLMVC